MEWEEKHRHQKKVEQWMIVAMWKIERSVHHFTRGEAIFLIFCALLFYYYI